MVPAYVASALPLQEGGSGEQAPPDDTADGAICPSQDLTLRVAVASWRRVGRWFTTAIGVPGDVVWLSGVVCELVVLEI